MRVLASGTLLKLPSCQRRDGQAKVQANSWRQVKARLTLHAVSGLQ